MTQPNGIFLDNLSEEQALERRKSYVEAWNTTMVDIWQDQIYQLGVIDTEFLYESPTAVTVSNDGRFLSFELRQEFLEYGLWQDYGTGKEVYRGNTGDIGRTKKRERRQWFSTPFFRSVYKLKGAMADIAGQQFLGVFANIFDKGLFREMNDYYIKNRRTRPI